MRNDRELHDGFVNSMGIEVCLSRFAMFERVGGREREPLSRELILSVGLALAAAAGTINHVRR